MVRALRAPAPHEWLLLGVLLVATDRYRWLMDDAFIYFRYADNLLFLGRGLVYNAGEYVEGFSSPLWMLLLVVLRASRLDYYVLVRALALVCAAGYGACLIWVNRRLAPRGITVNFPLAASAAHYGLTTHFSSGLETPLVQWLAPLYAAALLRPGSRQLQALMACAPLVRAECGLLWLAYVPWLVLRTRRLPLVFMISALLVNGAWLAFRVFYYADFLPNTFYLKDRAQWSYGWQYLQNVSETHAWPLVLTGLAACAWLGRKRLANTRIGPRALLLVSAAAYALYVARIGGDMLYHRYAALPVCLLLCASAGVIEAALLQLMAAPPRALGAGVALAIAFGFGAAYPPQLSSHPWFGSPGFDNWHAIADPEWHRRHPSLRFGPERAAEDARQRARYTEPRPPPSAAPIIVEGFCHQGFRRFEAYVINDYGLTDATLARLPRGFARPGHKQVRREARQMRDLMLRARREGGVWSALPHSPRWVHENRASLALLERKVHNRHAFVENVRLALTPIHLR